MASPSPGKWPWSLSSGSSSAHRSPSIFYFSFQNRPRRTTRRRKAPLTTTIVANLSSDQTRSSSLKNTPTHIRKLDDKGPSSVVPNSNLARKNGSPVKKMSDYFGKGRLWNRIFFASKKVRSIILLNLITIIYASDIPVVKEVEAIMDPSAFTVVRFALTAVPFVPFILRAHGDVQTRNAGMELGFWVSLGYLMQALGLLTSEAGRASFISLFTVIVVPMLDGMLGAKIPALTWFGALISLFGVAMLESSGSPPSVGDLLNFLSAVFFGVHMLRTEHISRNTKKKNFLPLLGYEVCVVAIFSTIWYFLEGWFGSTHGWDPGSWTWEMVCDWIVEFPWVPALYTGAFSTGFCLWVEMAAMLDVSATETAIIYALEPLWGASFAWFLLGERWGVTGWIGAALVLGGSLTVQIFGSSSPTKSGEEKNTREVDQLLVSDKQSGLSTSPVTVHSRKNITNLFDKSGEEKNTREVDQLLVSDKRSGLSTSPVTVHSRKNIPNLFDKKK